MQSHPSLTVDWPEANPFLHSRASFPDPQTPAFAYFGLHNLSNFARLMQISCANAARALSIHYSPITFVAALAGSVFRGFPFAISVPQ